MQKPVNTSGDRVFCLPLLEEPIIKGKKENAQVKRSLVKEFKQYPQLFSLFIDLLVMFILSLGAAVDLKGK